MEKTKEKYNKNLLSNIDSLLLIAEIFGLSINLYLVYPMVAHFSDIGIRSMTSHDSFDPYEGSTASRVVYKAGRFLKKKLKL